MKLFRSVLIVWATVGLHAAAAAPAPVAVVFPVDVESAVGFRKEGEAFVPLKRAVDLSTDRPVRIEAETPDESLGLETAADKDKGEAWVRSFRRLAYAYQADRARPFHLWARLRQGDQEAAIHVMGHQWSSHRDAVQAGLDPQAEHKKFAGQWRWVLLRPWQSQAGAGRIELVHSWPGSPEIDCLVLTAGPEPPDPKIARPARTAIRSYALQSVEFRLSAAVRLESAAVEGDLDGGQVQVSTDAGQTWAPARSVPLSGPFRLRWIPLGRAAPEGRATGFAARVLVDPSKYLLLDNGRTRIGVDAVGGGVFRIDSPALKTTFAAPAAAAELFTLELKKRGQPWVTPGDGKGRPPQGLLLTLRDARLLAARIVRSNGSPAAELTYAFLQDKLTAVATIQLDDGLWSTWSLALDNRSEWDILTWVFPRLAGLKVGPSGYDDRWVNTNVYEPWPAGFPPEDRPYPGWGALGWVDLHDEQAGLSFHVRDPREGQVNFKLRPTALRAGETVELETVREHGVPAGTQRTWTYRMRLHAGDWHAAADAYGEWFRKEFGPADHWPDWVRDSNGWISENAHLRDARFQWPMLLETFEQGRRLGLTHVQVWGQFGSSSCGSFWWPSPKYGPIEAFARVNRQIRQRGGHVGYYLMYHVENRYNIIDTLTFDGYLPRSAYPADVPVMTEAMFLKSHLIDDPLGRVTAWPQNAQQWAQFRANLQRLHAEKKTTTWADSPTWPAHSMATMHPNDPDWQQWLVLWTIHLYVGRWHCDTAYHDVLGCGRVGRSFDLRRGEHGHIPNGNEDIARLLTEEGRKIEPTFTLSAEGKCELVTRWAMGMTSSQHYGWIYIAPHRYTHPDHILYLGAANGGYQQMAYNCELAYLYGARFELILTGEVDTIRKIVTFREPIKRFVFRARYRDTVGLRVEGPGIEATRHDRSDGQAQTTLVTVVNRSRTPAGRLTLDLALRPAGAFWITDDWSAARADLTEPSAGRFQTPIPPHHVSALLLVNRVPAEETLLAGLRPVPAPGACQTRVWIANLNAETRRLATTLQTPAGQGPEQTVEIEPFGVWNQTLTSRLPAAAPAFGDVTLRADGRPLAAGFLYPLVEDGSFEADGTPDPDSPDGQRLIRFGPAPQWQGTFRRLNLPAGRSYRIRVMAKRTGPQGQMYVLVRVQDRAGAWHHTSLHFPKDRYNVWLELTGQFQTPKDLAQADVYLYNMQSQETVWYDHVVVDMVK